MKTLIDVLKCCEKQQPLPKKLHSEAVVLYTQLAHVGNGVYNTQRALRRVKISIKHLKGSDRLIQLSANTIVNKISDFSTH